MQTVFQYFEDSITGVQAVLCYHGDLSLPAIGGCRLHAYATFDDAKMDAKRLAVCMYHKAKAHDLPLCGAKLVCMPGSMGLHPAQRADFFQRLGGFVEQQAGGYIAAMDSGVTLADMDHMAQSTSYISNTSSLGAPASATAYGVYSTIERINTQYLNQPLAKLSLAIMGVGAVGSLLAKHFDGKVAALYLGDPRRDEIEPLLGPLTTAKWLPPGELCAVSCDVLAPCALGQMINRRLVPELRCKVVAGAANNPLADDLIPADLAVQGIAYIPDYVINGGGLIACAATYFNRADWRLFGDKIAEKTDIYCQIP